MLYLFKVDCESILTFGYLVPEEEQNDFQTFLRIFRFSLRAFTIPVKLEIELLEDDFHNSCTNFVYEKQLLFKHLKQQYYNVFFHLYQQTFFLLSVHIKFHVKLVEALKVILKYADATAVLTVAQLSPPFFKNLRLLSPIAITPNCVF